MTDFKGDRSTSHCTGSNWLSTCLLSSFLGSLTFMLCSHKLNFIIKPLGNVTKISSLNNFGQASKNFRLRSPFENLFHKKMDCLAPQQNSVLSFDYDFKKVTFLLILYCADAKKCVLSSQNYSWADAAFKRTSAAAAYMISCFSFYVELERCGLLQLCKNDKKSIGESSHVYS